TNGIRINGTRVAEGRLNEGDEVTIGNHRYQVRWDGAAAPPLAQRGRLTRETARLENDPANADDLLESCDQPIPLREPSSPLPKRRTALDLPSPPPGQADVRAAEADDKSMI